MNKGHRVQKYTSRRWPITRIGERGGWPPSNWGTNTNLLLIRGYRIYGKIKEGTPETDGRLSYTGPSRDGTRLLSDIGRVGHCLTQVSTLYNRPVGPTSGLRWKGKIIVINETGGSWTEVERVKVWTYPSSHKKWPREFLSTLDILV